MDYQYYMELSNRLNRYSEKYQCHGRITAEAADTIEAISHEIERLKNIAVLNNSFPVDQLKEMGREWVYVKLLVPLYNIESGYYVKKVSLSNDTKFFCGFPDVVPYSRVRSLFYSDYGYKWLAYPHKPKED